MKKEEFDNKKCFLEKAGFKLNKITKPIKGGLEEYEFWLSSYAVLSEDYFDEPLPDIKNKVAKAKQIFHEKGELVMLFNFPSHLNPDLAKTIRDRWKSKYPDLRS
ncbi:MAG: hypothetical protein HQ596_02670 [Candidatus Saganbacteria bacterium]|nr:hypothetical protein [Candidatus Saganbacteria bacterium]